MVFQAETGYLCYFHFFRLLHQQLISEDLVGHKFFHFCVLARRKE